MQSKFNDKIGTGWCERPIFIMTVDVDSWFSLIKFYSVNYDPQKADAQDGIVEGLNNLLQIFDKYEIKATFFTPAEVAIKHTMLIRKIHKLGHEVACHGLFHEKNEYLGTSLEQEQNIKRATDIIRAIINWHPVGFRAPCLRINKATLDILEKSGYLYDSSIVPTFVPGYYGFLFASKKPYRPSTRFITKKGLRKIVEIPVSVNPLVPLPLSAAWMRNLGLSWVKLGVKMNFIMGNPVVFYIHPRDVVQLPKVKGVPWHVYVNVGETAVKWLDQIIVYAKKMNAKFMRASDFVQYWSVYEADE